MSRKTYAVDAFCMGTKGMITLKFEGSLPHPYTMEGVPESNLSLYGLPRTCPSCRKILDDYRADLDRMDKIINGPPRAKPAEPVMKPEPVVPAVEDIPAPIEDVLARVKPRELEYAGSGEA